MTKDQIIEKGNVNPILRCEFYIKKKNRKCSMQRKATERFCSEHLSSSHEVYSSRVNCPYDGRHSVWEKDLAKHLKKCNARPLNLTEAWYEKDANSKLKNESLPHSGIKEIINDNELESYLSTLKLLENSYDPLKLQICEHEGLSSRLTEVTNKKHASQQSSLIGNLKRFSMLGVDKFYLEFGCGKGEFSRYINLSSLYDFKEDAKRKTNSNEYGFAFIDRGNNRMKMDSKILKDCAERGSTIIPKIKRSKIDIRHLLLDKFLEDIHSDNLVLVSKHLCGCATDLTLKSLLNSSVFDDGRFNGLLVAMCCRHACNYEDLLPQSREFLKKNGFNDNSAFTALKRMATWAVCSSKLPSEVSKFGLNVQEKEKMGILARRIIDESRLQGLKDALKGKCFELDLFLYAKPETTLENSCLLIRRL